MAEFVGHPFVQALAWTLVHFLWQGAAIGAIALLLMRTSQLSWTRYAIGVGALVAMFVAPVVTLFVQLSAAILSNADVTLTSTSAAALAVSLPEFAPVTQGTSFAGMSDLALAAIVAAWLAGVLVFSIRLAGGWLVARRVAAEAVKPAATEIQRLAAGVAQRLGVRRAVSVLESSLVAVPVLIGWIKPVIVLPAAAIAGLSPDQLESLVAHELAHVRRHDFLINLLQSVVEALLFYHPAVWWVSRRVRAERELCCDDMAVGVCDRLVYAEALKELAAMASPRLALAATDGDLVSRIRRVLGQVESQSGAARWVPIAIMAATIAVAVPATFVIAAPGADASSPEAQSRVHPELVHVIDEIPVARIPDALEEQDPRAIQAEREQARRRQADAEYEAVLREYEALVRRYRSAIDAEWIRPARERGLVAVPDVDEAMVQAEWQAARERDQRAVSQEEVIARELARARTEAEAMRTLFERGLVSESQLKDMEAKLRAFSQLTPDEARTKREEILRQQRDAKTVEEQRHLDEVLQQLAAHRKLRDAELEHMKRTIDEHLRQNAHARNAEMHEVRRVLEAHRDALVADRSARGRARVDGPAASGDLLEIRIANEPELPTHYEVRSDGTIRVPFLGSFKVAGQTAAQVQAAIGKQMADRKLGSADQVTVAVLRAR